MKSKIKPLNGSHCEPVAQRGETSRVARLVPATYCLGMLILATPPHRVYAQADASPQNVAPEQKNTLPQKSVPAQGTLAQNGPAPSLAPATATDALNLGGNPRATIDEPGDNRRDDNSKRRSENQARLENEMRQLMNWLGCNDTGVQDAILEHIGAETRARQTLRVQSRKLFEAVRAERPLSLPVGEVPDALLIARLIDFHAGLEADRVRREATEKALDDKINYTKNPRLEATLLLLGVIGDGPQLITLRQRLPWPQTLPPIRVQVGEQRLREELQKNPEVALPNLSQPALGVAQGAPQPPPLPPSPRPVP